MLIVSYDIQSTKVRSKFSKFLKRFGYRLQFSVYKIKNSERILQTIISKIKAEFEPIFSEADSIIIFSINEKCEAHYFGYAKHEEEGIIVV